MFLFLLHACVGTEFLLRWAAETPNITENYSNMHKGTSATPPSQNVSLFLDVTKMYREFLNNLEDLIAEKCKTVLK